MSPSAQSGLPDPDPLPWSRIKVIPSEDARRVRCSFLHDTGPIGSLRGLKLLGAKPGPLCLVASLPEVSFEPLLFVGTGQVVVERSRGKRRGGGLEVLDGGVELAKPGQDDAAGVEEVGLPAGQLEHLISPLEALFRLAQVLRERPGHVVQEGEVARLAAQNGLEEGNLVVEA